MKKQLAKLKNFSEKTASDNGNLQFLRNERCSKFWAHRSHVGRVNDAESLDDVANVADDVRDGRWSRWWETWRGCWCRWHASRLGLDDAEPANDATGAANDARPPNDAVNVAHDARRGWHARNAGDARDGRSSGSASHAQTRSSLSHNVCGAAPEHREVAPGCRGRFLVA